MSIRKAIARVFENSSDRALAELLCKQGQVTTRAATALSELMSQIPQGVSEQLSEIVLCEHEGDRLTDEMRTLLDDAFILKHLQKDHASRLVGHLDDILDDMRDAARYIDTYIILEATKEASEFASTISEMVTALAGLLKSPLTLTNEMVGVVYAKLKQLEAKADQLRSEGVRALVVKHAHAPHEIKSDVLILLVAWKDIYSKLERTTDHCFHAVEEISVMVRKY